MSRWTGWLAGPSAALLAFLVSISGAQAETESAAAQAAVHIPAQAAQNVPAAAASGRPLVIVLDTSGSMQDDDGNGTIKLAGAQAALSQVIRGQRPGASIGLWTYPSDGDCAPGAFNIPVKELEQRSMIRTIRGLTAGGGTPTGEALRAVVDQLTEEGYEGATILLISDGLSTCESDPCEVAQDITTEGFDLTVQAAGFQISPEGLAELQCIADATGGQTYEATDADQLEAVADEATRAVLTMTVEGIPDRTPAGSASRVTVVVRNDSAVDIQNARVSFNFADVLRGSNAVVPAVLPPLVRFGNMPAGSAQEHTWVVAYGSRGKVGEADYRISAWGSNAQPVTNQGTVEVVDADQTLDDGGGLIGSLKGKRIAILGDSYSSGEGAGIYLPGTDVNPDKEGDGNRCHKSASTYLYPLFEERDVELLACSGATTHYLDEQTNGVREEQVPLLSEVQTDHGPVDAAFMSVGGNDIQFGNLVKACLFGHPTYVGPLNLAGAVATALSWDRRCSDDQDLLDLTDRLLDGLPAELIPTYRRVYDALNSRDIVHDRGGDPAPLYIVAYPQPFPEQQWTSWCRGFDSAEVGFANRLVDRLNEKIESSVSRLRKEGYRIQMITTTQESFLPDNTACPRPGAEEYMNSVSAGQGLGTGLADWWNDTKEANQFMHPNVKGYRAETNTILAWSVSADESLPNDITTWRLGDDPGWWSQIIPTSTLARVLTPPLPTAGPALLDAATGRWTTDPLDVRGGQALEIKVVNAAPGSSVVVTLQSRARVVGTIQVNESGEGTGTVTVPRRVPSGTHQLSVLAFDARFNPVVATQEVDVARAVPMWLMPLAALTLLLFLVAELCRRWDRRIRARSAIPGNQVTGTP